MRLFTRHLDVGGKELRMSKEIDNGFVEGDQGIVADLHLLKPSNSELSR